MSVVVELRLLGRKWNELDERSAVASSVHQRRLRQWLREHDFSL